MAEVQRLLERRRVDPETVAAVIAELVDGGWIDDARYAARFAEDRRALDAWGPERIARRLRALGVESDHIESALAERTDADELDAAVALLRRRFPQPPDSPREAQRALALLVRKGYGIEQAHDALRRHAGAGEFDDA